MTTEGVGGVIEVAGLSRRFGRALALDGVQLEVPRGVVFGLVGENGAGKTTLIKHLLGLYRAETGTVRVLGADPVAQPVEVLSRVGYLSEDRDLPDWMRIGELLNYLRAFYPTWDVALAEQLRDDFDLDPNARIKGLSQGQRARVGLVGALAVGIGAIGVMNTMVMSVFERTREIGIRKSVGARSTDILNQFLIESSMLSGMGGLIGVTIAYAVAIIVRLATPVPMSVPISAIFVGVGMSSIVGLFFGIYPARQASKLDPIEALRAE